MGTPHYAQMILQTLLDAEDMEVALVLTQPDRPVGRKKVLTAPAVKILAEKYGIEVLQPDRLSQEGISRKISEARPDFIVVAAFGQLLPRSILDIAPCINLHASLLPQYRGASPIQQSLLNGDLYSGVTSMRMEEGLDSGPILGYTYFKIPQELRLQGLTRQLSNDACILVLDTIRYFEHIHPLPQTRATATHCKKIRKDDGEIIFDDALLLYNKYRAFEGWPGIFTSEGLKLIEIKLIDTRTEHQQAQILSIENESITIGCRIGSVQIMRLQPASKKAMNAKSYLLGKGLKIGDILI
ncbi:MAG: methionyl-tRNA formyltransferase [Epsilonproteobacteria bacterium]|nr:MAG: methionyl-tRNA formyltransferase [Campylobacterota bacterium]